MFLKNHQNLVKFLQLSFHAFLNIFPKTTKIFLTCPENFPEVSSKLIKIDNVQKSRKRLINTCPNFAYNF